MEQREAQPQRLSFLVDKSHAYGLHTDSGGSSECPERVIKNSPHGTGLLGIP
jgi:hypothetical protein